MPVLDHTPAEALAIELVRRVGSTSDYALGKALAERWPEHATTTSLEDLKEWGHRIAQQLVDRRELACAREYETVGRTYVWPQA